MKLKERNGILYPANMKIRSWIICGIPGSGKSHLNNEIGGWPGEVGIDLSADNWWKVGPLAYRPRVVHFALPFIGFDQSHPVYADLWQKMESYPDVEWKRIKIPQKKKFLLASDWRKAFVFDFILPPPVWILKQREKRFASEDKRLMDADLSEAWIRWQVHIYWSTAWHFHHSGLQVIVRPFSTARPYSFPLLKRIMRKQLEISKEEIKPDSNWSKVSNVHKWILESAPDVLIHSMTNPDHHEREGETLTSR